MVTGVSAGSVQNNNKMNPITKGAVLGGATGLLVATCPHISDEFNNLSFLKKNLESDKLQLSNLKNSINTSAILSDYNDKLIKNCEVRIKDWTSKIASAKKSMPKNIMKGIVKSPILYIGLLVGAGIGVVAKAVKNKKAQKAE